MNDHKNRPKAILDEIEPDDPAKIKAPPHPVKTTIVNSDQIQTGGDVIVGLCRTTAANKSKAPRSIKQKSGKSARLVHLAGFCFLIVLSLSLVYSPALQSDSQFSITTTRVYQHTSAEMHRAAVGLPPALLDKDSDK